MNLVVDYGNTRIKIGLFEQHNFEQHLSFESEEELIAWCDDKSFDHAIVSSVARPSEYLIQKIKVHGKSFTMSPALHLPIHIRYATPNTLGVDRLAGACGALELMPNRDCLVIDLGSCINYELVDENGTYFGGAISPGVNMRFKAMHTFTAKLPIVEPVEEFNLIGSSTQGCMQSGVMIGILSELEGMIKRYKEKYPKLGVILCGGDAYLFENKLKEPIFVAPNLVLMGLNRILLHNVGL